VSILRIITAPDMSAGPAQTKMNPRVAHRQALLATIAGWPRGLYRIEMHALLAMSGHL